MAIEYSTIRKAILRTLFADGEEDKHLYARAFIIARGWYEVEYTGRIEKAYGNKSVPLLVGADRVVDLPDDYVEWNMVGIRRGEQLVNLLNNPALVPLPADGVAAAAQPGSGAALTDYHYTYLDLNGVDVMGYGYPSLRPGEFSIDRASRTLLVSSQISPGQELYLSYLSDDASCRNETLIHPLAINWLGFYIQSFLLEKKEPARAAKYGTRAENARSDYMLNRSPIQLADLYAAMRDTLAQRK